MKRFKKILVLTGIVLTALPLKINAADIEVAPSSKNLSGIVSDIADWKNAKLATISLTAQPMALPKPDKTQTKEIRVQALSDGKFIQFRLQWEDSEKSEAGPLGKYSDGVALQFPAIEGNPPPVFMGAKGKPVHIFHWKAQYQKDIERGRKEEITDIYPNANLDMYTMDYKDYGKLHEISESAKRQYMPGQAAGNPQSYSKLGIDEILAEGFGTSAVMEQHLSMAFAEWKNGVWTVIVTRPLEYKKGSKLKPAGKNFIAFAVWQGGKGEIGSRKSLTMSWVPLVFKPTK